jgi:hypothetical protein
MTGSLSGAGSEVDWSGNVGILMSKFRSVRSRRCDMHLQAVLRATSRSSSTARPPPMTISGRSATHVPSPLLRVRVDGVEPHRKSQPRAEYPWTLSRRLPTGALSSAVSLSDAARDRLRQCSGMSAGTAVTARWRFASGGLRRRTRGCCLRAARRRIRHREPPGVSPRHRGAPAIRS